MDVRRVIAFVALCAFGCSAPADREQATPSLAGSGQDSAASTAPPSSQGPAGRSVASLLSVLLSSAREISGDSIFIWSPESREDSMWIGVRIDSALFDELHPFYPELSPEFRHHWEFYSVARVRLDSGVTGFIVRAPGMYSSTQLDLLVYLWDSAHFLPPVELAESWGDAGEWYREEAVLVDTDRDGRRDVVRHLHRTAMDMENEPPGPTTSSDSVWVLAWRGRGFTPPALVSTALPGWARHRSIP